LDPAVRAALRGLEPRNADRVAEHLVVAGTVVDEDPELALAHARAARDRASRVAVVREAVGVAAYHAGDYAEAARELRAYRRMSGDQGYRAVLADVERALGRPEVALRLVAEALAQRPSPEEAAELYLVESGARRDLGEDAAARLVLETALGGRPRPEMVQDADSATLRLAAAYADLLRDQGASDLAELWTAALMAADPENLLGIAEVPEIEFSEEELSAGPEREPGAEAAVTESSVTGTADVDPLPGSRDGADANLQSEVEAEVAELLGETEPAEGGEDDATGH
jgi:tetratricopeptide (TPR) repeat protein